jgi:RNA polymerase sigma-70 factor (family 1)
MQVSETDIVQQIKAGDIRSFEQLFHAYCEELVRYATTILKDADEAQDVVQHLFVTLWTKRDTLQVNSSLKSYLYRSVYNSSLNRIKQVTTQQKHEDYLGCVAHSYGSAASAVLESKEVQSAIDTAIAALPDQCRLIFTMSRFEGKKYQQIADELQLSVKTIENQMGKALKHMREQLQTYLPSCIIFLLLGQ